MALTDVIKRPILISSQSDEEVTMTIQPQTYHVTRLEAITILWRPDNLTPGGDTCTPILETANTATSTTLPKKERNNHCRDEGKNPETVLEKQNSPDNTIDEHL